METEKKRYLNITQVQFSMQQKIKPLPGYVLVEPIEDEQKSAGGVYLPESTKDKPMKGKVIACGAGEKVGTFQGIYNKKKYDLVDCPVSEGQIVIFKKWTNQEVQHEGKEYLLVKFDELLAVVE